MRRFQLLDGLRGYFLMFMLLHHLPLADGSWLALLHHGSLGYVQDAQGFVFLSGLVFAMVGTRLHLMGRDAEIGRRARTQAARVARYALTLVAGLVLAALVLPGSSEYWRHFLPDLQLAPGAHAVMALLLLYQPSFLDILPQYVLYLLAAPLLLRWIHDGHGAAVAAGSLALWSAVQLGWHIPLTVAIEGTAGALMPGAFVRGHFNPFAWQVLFVAGLLAGADAARGAPVLSRWLAPERKSLLLVALAVLAGFLYYRVGWELGWLNEAVAHRFIALASRTEFGPAYLLNFAAMAYAVAWLFTTAPSSANAAVRRAAAWLRGLLEHPLLRLLGRHGLQVYTAHVVIVYLVAMLEWWAGPFGRPAATIVALGAVGLLVVPAWLRENRLEAARLRGAGAGD